MTSNFEWDAEKMFQLYLHDYMLKNNMHEAAETFRKEAGISNNPVVIDAPKGFLLEWWSFLHDTYTYSEAKQQEQTAGTSTQAKQMMNHPVAQNICPVVPQLEMNQQRPGKLPVSFDFNKMQAAYLLAAKNYEEEQRKKLSLSKSSVTPSSHLQQQIYSQAQQQIMRDNRNGVSLERSLTKDPTLFGMQKPIFPITGPRGTGINEGVNPISLNGWPLEVLNSLLQAPNRQQQFELLTEQHKSELLAQLLSCTPGNRPSTFPRISKFGNQNLMLTIRDASLKNIQDCTNIDNELTEKNVESFLSNEVDDVDRRSTPFSILKRRPTASNKNEHKGFTFEEFGCLSSSDSKVLCCHYSSDGKLLASAGHEKKVFIWNTETFNFENTSKGHSFLITDVRFRPNSTVFATSSFDRTVQIWDAARPSKSLLKLVGHAEQVMSLDFHPGKADLLCSCDSNDEIRLWNVNQSACTRISRGATKQVRFQPQLGKLLATASGNCVNVIDVETNSLLFCLKGHAKEVLSLCWEASGKYIASVSEDSARVWSAVTGRECIHELHSNGNKFQSCTFHPGYSQLLIIGGYQSIKLWNPTESNRTLTVQAHKGLISSLADSLETEMVASASHDKCVKLWK